MWGIVGNYLTEVLHRIAQNNHTEKTQKITEYFGGEGRKMTRPKTKIVKTKIIKTKSKTLTSKV